MMELAEAEEKKAGNTIPPANQAPKKSNNPFYTFMEASKAAKPALNVPTPNAKFTL